MVSRLGFTSILFRLGDSTTSAATAKLTSSSWAWPSCKQHPRTDSFRVSDGDTVYKSNVNSGTDSTDTSFTRSSEESFSASDKDGSESLIRGLVKTDRLLFEPGGDTSSILEEPKMLCGGGGGGEGLKLNPFKESVAMAMASDDPYLDFKKSMEEMVVAHGMKDWERLEELLAWYLSVNGKKTHRYIVRAFVDLLVGLVASSAPAHEDSGGDGGDDDDEISGGDLLPRSSSLSSSSCNEIEEVEWSSSC